MIKIFVDKQGNWQLYQPWQNDLVMTNPESFSFYNVKSVPEEDSVFVNWEFKKREVVEDIEEEHIASIDPVAIWEILADQEAAIIELQSKMEE